jgi:hypothetical protein
VTGWKNNEQKEKRVTGIDEGRTKERQKKRKNE